LALKSGHYRAVMFVSGNAVQYFLRQIIQTHGQALLAPDTRAWTPGPGTERALLELG
jgi:uroporphyrinogen-III synthase